MSHTERVRRRLEAPANFAPESVPGFATLRHRTRSAQANAAPRRLRITFNAANAAPAPAQQNQSAVQSTVANTAQASSSSLHSTAANTAQVQPSVQGNNTDRAQVKPSLSGIINTSAVTSSSAPPAPVLTTNPSTIYPQSTGAAESAGDVSFTSASPSTSRRGTTILPSTRRPPGPNYHPSTGLKSFTGPGSRAPRRSLIVILRANPNTTITISSDPETVSSSASNSSDSEYGPRPKRRRVSTRRPQAGGEESTSQLVEQATAALERNFTPLGGKDDGEI